MIDLSLLVTFYFFPVHFGVYSIPLRLLYNLSLGSYHFDFLSVPSFLAGVGLGGSGGCRCWVLRRGIVFFLSATLPEFLLSCLSGASLTLVQGFDTAGTLC